LTEVVKVLVEKGGANLERSDRYCQTPLIAAASNKSWEVLRLLVEKGANTAVQATDGRTALSCAVSGGPLDIVIFLVEHGADVE
jgi:ankyrin repeat protein